MFNHRLLSPPGEGKIEIAGKARTLAPLRAAFTMIELLVVIGILILLGVLFLGAAKHITGQAKAQQTRATLEILKSMLENYKSNTHFAKPVTIVGVSASPYGLTLSNLASYPVPQNAQQSGLTMGQIQAPQSVILDGLALNNASHLTGDAAHNAVLGTEYMLTLMLGSQENQNLFGNLPKNVVTTDAATLQFFSGAVGTNGKVILDGWGNPIIFVPAGGLTQMIVDPGSAGNGYQVMTTSGLKPAGWDPVALQQKTPGVVFEIQPFFASAGPDGDFSNTHGHDNPPGSLITSNGPPSKYPDITDDNVYSFQQ
jgi:type II secretory pathway pseudopilin PulG